MEIPARYQKQYCVICRDSETEPLFRLEGEYLENETGDSLCLDLNYGVCRECGLVFTDPQLADECWLEFYRGCRNGSNQGESEAQLLDRYEDGTLSLAREYVKSGEDVLDIGCGGGKFLHYLRADCGCSPVGLEISRILARQARSRFDLPVVEAVLEDAGFQEQSFDVVSLVHVLEHLYEPFHVLEQIKALLRSKGRLIIAVPSVYRPLSGIRNIYSSHNTMFSPLTLERLMAIAGYQLLAKRIDRDMTYIFEVGSAVVSSESDYQNVIEFLPEYIRKNSEAIRQVEERLMRYLSIWRSGGQKVFIWGAGEHTRKLFRQCKFTAVDLAGVIDSDPGCWGRECCGLPVVSPASGCSQADEILISSNAFEQEIRAAIQQLNPHVQIRTLYS